MKHWSLKTKGLVYIILVALCPLLISGAYIYKHSENEVIAMTVDNVQLKQEAKDYMITTSIGSIISELKILSRSNALEDYKSSDLTRILKQQLSSLDEAYIGLGFVNNHSEIEYVSRYNDKLKSSYVNEAANEVKVYIDGETYDNQGNVIAYISVPVFNAINQLAGSLFASFYFPPSYFSEEDYNLTMENTYIYTVDGKLLFHPNLVPYIHKQTGQHDKLIAQYSSKFSEVEVGYNIAKDEFKSYVIVHRVVNEGQWMMIEIIPIEEIRKETFPIFVRIFSSIFITIFIAIGFFYLFFNSITKRLLEIVKVTKQGANGTLHVQHLDASVKDEIGILAHSINGMMQRLEVMFSRLDAVINQNKSPVMVLDEYYRFSYLNKAAEEMLGVTAETIIGKFTPITFMDFAEVEKRALQYSEQVGRRIQPGPDLFIELRKQHMNYDMEFTIVNTNGERIPVYDRSSAIKDKNGKLLGIISIMQDLSKQREVEQAKNRLQEIVESARDLIASVDRQSNIIYINEAGKRMLGIQQHENIQNLNECLPEEIHQMLIENSSNARQEGYFEIEAQFTNRLDEKVSVSISIVSHTDTYTGELLYSCIARDLTELLDTQEKLVEATALAEKAAAAKGNFLALMSHEIRTPLNGIIGLSQLLQKTKLDQLQREYTIKIKESSDTLLHIVNDILDFSKLEVSKIELEQRLFNLHNVVEHVTTQVSHYMGGKDNFEFKVVLDETLPKLLIGDSLRIEQILNNLCVNAVKFTHHGVVELTISTVQTAEDYIQLQFTVMDTGIGMSEEQLSKLFTPFTQADSSTTRQYGGTGLGLVISQNLVYLMGGQLEVVSEPNIGSQFKFNLTLKMPEQLVPETTFELEANRFFAWVIEDHDGMRKYWVDLLNEQNIDAIGMTSWKESYYQLRRLGKGFTPSLIIMDMEMPDMYGIETWLSFKAEATRLNIPIIVLTTTFGREELAPLEQQVQPDLVMTKPIHPGYFKKAIYELLTHNSVSPNNNNETNRDLQTIKHNKLVKYRVLLAEDNKINQLVADEMLKLLQIDVDIANNGLEAIDLIQAKHYDLILMDIHMPFMDGIEATKWIRQRNEFESIPIIAVTANVLDSDHEHYMKIGMQQVMTKPLEFEALQKLLMNYLNTRTIDKSSNKLQIDEVQVQLLNVNCEALEVEQALKRLNGKVNIYKHMLEQFKTDYSSFIKSLAENIEVGNLKAVQRMLHTLKGASSYLGATKLQVIASEMEHYSKEANTENITSNIDELSEAIEAVISDIQKLLENF